MPLTRMPCTPSSVGEGLGGGLERALGRGVGTEGRLDAVRRHGVHHHDAATAALDHRRHRRLGHLQRAPEVDVHRGAPLVERRGLEGLVVAVLEGVVDEHVETPEPFDGGVDRCGARVGVGDVEADGFGTAAERPHLRRHLLAALHRSGAEHDVGAVLREQHRDVAAHARSDTGDDGDLPLEQHGGPPGQSLTSGATSAAKAAIWSHSSDAERLGKPTWIWCTPISR